MTFNWHAYDRHEDMSDEELEAAVVEANAAANEYLDSRGVPTGEQLDIHGELIQPPVTLDDE